MKFPRIVLACTAARLFWIVSLALSMQTAKSQESAAKMRVGLSRFSSASELTLRAEPGARLLDGQGRERAAGGGPFVLTRTGSVVTARDASGRSLGETPTGTFWRLQSDEGATVLTISTPKGAKHRYRGELEIGATGGRLHVVNEVGLEDYVRGVIGPEMGSRAPLEALKAQAVASRTFALSSLGRWTSDGYDLRDSTDSQVYSGVEAERAECDRAVRDTSGLILTLGGHAIAAYFCADCGGFTAPGETPEECPHAVSDADAHGLPNRPLLPTWTVAFAPEKLTALLARRAPNRAGATSRLSRNATFASRSAPAGTTLAMIAVIENDISGRVRKLRLTWVPAHMESKPAESSTTLPDAMPIPPSEPAAESGRSSGSAKQEKPKQERAKQIEADRLPPGATTSDLSAAALRALLGADALRSTLFTVHRSADGMFVFEGRGWGHGRGLCQVGAMALAAARHPLDFRAILRRYYAGAVLAPLGATQENEEGASAP